MRLSTINIAAGARICILALAAIIFSGCDREPAEWQPVHENPGTIQNPDNPEPPAEDSDSPDTPQTPDKPVDTPVEPCGSGTEADPYNVAAVMALPEEAEAVWVEGWITGNITDADFILSDTPDIIDTEASVVVALSGVFARKYALVDHPEYLGRRVRLECAVGHAYGSRALVNLRVLLFLSPEAGRDIRRHY